MHRLKQLRNVGIVSIGNIMISAVSVVGQLGIIFLYGATPITDAFLMARSISESLSKLLFVSQTNEVFLPLFSEKYAERPQRGWQLLSGLIICICFAAIVIGVCVFGTRDWLIQIFAPGFDDAQIALTATFIVGWTLIIFTTMIIDVLRSVLYFFKDFHTTAFTEAAVNICSVIGLYIGYTTTLGISGFIYGYLIGRLIMIIYLIGSIRNAHGWEWTWRLHWPDIREYGQALRKFFFSNMTSFISSFAYKVSVSLLPTGSLSLIEYSKRIFNFLADLTFTALGNVAFVDFVKQQKDKVKLRLTMANNLRFLAISGIIFLCGLVVLQPLIARAFSQGEFSKDQAYALSILLIIFGVSFLPNGWYYLLRKAALAARHIRAAVIITIIAELIQANLYVVLGWYYGMYGIVASMAASSFCVALLYIYHFRFRSDLYKKSSIDSTYAKSE